VRRYDKGMKNPVIVGVTGASGSILASKTVDALLELNIPIVLVASNPARMVWQLEMSETFGESLERWAENPSFSHHAISDLQAPIASGTYPGRGMVIVPGSMATISAIVNGISDNLIRRAADVCLKEKRPFVIVPRESPLNRIHLSNLAALDSFGTSIVTADPPYYLPIKTLEDSATFTAQRVLLALNIIKELPEEFRYGEG
tara:strand:+ start:2263 stop:2868 length:606 start_codon:yes stop_codon:yes gene_type:complete